MGHVSLITLGVDDLERAARFYEALGWERSSASVDGVVVFLRGGAVPLSLFGRDDLAAETGRPATRQWATDTVLAMNVADEEEVEATLAAAARAGATIARPGQRADWGGTTGVFADPDGHLWEVAHNPGFGLEADGRVRLQPDDP